MAIESIGPALNSMQTRALLQDGGREILSPGLSSQVQGPHRLGNDIGTGSSDDFENVLKSLDRTEQKEKEAGRLMEAFARGEDVPVHTVMAAAQEAQLAIEALAAVRNRALDAFHEIMRTQI